MLKQLIYSTGIFMLMFAGRTLGLMAVGGPCPKMSAKKLNMTAYLGKWYTHSMYPLLSKEIPECRYVEFIKNTNLDAHEKKYLYTAIKSEIRDGAVQVTKSGIEHLDESGGSYTLAPSDAFPSGMQLYVLETDNESYALQFMCISVNNILSLHWAVIQTRKRMPPASVENAALSLARSHGIHLNDLWMIPQAACPTDA